MRSFFLPWLDDSIIGLYLLGTLWIGLAVRKYVTRVEDFLVADREMNVYLGIASLASTEFGIIGPPPTRADARGRDGRVENANSWQSVFLEYQRRAALPSSLQNATKTC